MKRPLWNLLIDISSFIVFMFMISTGLLLKYVLPPGSGREEMLLAGRGRGHRTMEVFMGLSRHEWGTVHFTISLIFLGFLIVHLALHWTWIAAMLWGTKTNPQPKKRRMITVGVVVFVILTIAFPWLGQWLGQKQTVTRADIIENHRSTGE